MFAYCGNNPTNRIDNSGEGWGLLIGAGVVAAVISGISNAVSTARAGGSIEDCLVAGLVGTAGGAMGFAVAAIAGFSSWGNLAGRAVATTISNLGTSLALNGEITTTDLAKNAVDVTMDVCFSTIVYYYNPIEDLIPQTAINATVDGLIDIAENELYYMPKSNQAANNIASNIGLVIRNLTM